MHQWWQDRGKKQRSLVEGIPPPPPPPVDPVAVPLPPPPPPINIPPPPPASPWLQRLAHQKGHKVLGTIAEELHRILSLPVIPEGVARCPDREGYNASLVLPNAPDDFRLRDIQLDGIWTYEMYGGLFGPIGVGWGKTLITLIAGVKALTSRKHYRSVIIVPPEVFGQLVDKDLPWARSRINFHGIAFRPVRGDTNTRMQICRAPGPGVWIYSYSSLSTQSGYEELTAIQATAYILDEAHNLANATAARTQRWQTCMREQLKSGIIERTKKNVGDGPMSNIEVVALSGTLTKKNIADYAHLAARSLGPLSPVPIRDKAIRAWGQVIGADVSATARLTNQEVRILDTYLNWAEQNGIELKMPTDKEGRQRVRLTHNELIQQAYQERLSCSPGVISTSDQGVDASLLISCLEPTCPDSPEMRHQRALMKKVVEEQQTPGGDAIDYGMHQYKWLWELSAGFYNQLIWPDIEKLRADYLAKWNRAITEDQAEILLEKAKQHNEMLQDYHKKLRHWLDEDHVPGCDTPLLVALEISRQVEGHEVKHRLPRSLIDAYVLQRQHGPHTYPDLPERYSIPIRVTDYKIRAAAKWAKKQKKKEGGIVWYHHPEIGKWLHEVFTEEGIAHTFAPAGQNELAYEEGIVIASFSHGTGKNLQHQSHNLFVELRREASIMEQTLGRTHRSGQKADRVRASILIGNGFDLALFSGILRDADYMQSTLGQKQRLCYADYDPVIPPVNPRLMMKLGIITKEVGAVAISAWNPVTPEPIKHAADLFRPPSYN